MLEGRTFTLYTDHKPLIFALRQKSEKASPRQARFLDYISQFTQDIRHIDGVDNTPADRAPLSRIETLSSRSELDFIEIAKSQETDPELKRYLSSETAL